LFNKKLLLKSSCVYLPLPMDRKEFNVIKNWYGIIYIWTVFISVTGRLCWRGLHTPSR